MLLGRLILSTHGAGIWCFDDKGRGLKGRGLKGRGLKGRGLKGRGLDFALDF